MKIKERKNIPDQGRKKITKLSVDPDDADIIYATIERAEGVPEDLEDEGTELNAALFEKINGREDDSVSFINRDDNDLPSQESDLTQIVTKQNGELWILPPADKGNPFLVSSSNVSSVTSVNGKMGAVTLGKGDVGLGNVQNVDQTNATNISAGTLNNARLNAEVTRMISTYNTGNTRGVSNRDNSSRLIVKAGKITGLGTGTGSQTLTFQNGAFPNACLGCVMTMGAGWDNNNYNNSQWISSVSVSGATFRMGCGPQSGTMWYIAIGH